MNNYDNHRIIVDTPAANAGLGFANFARALSHAIQSSKPQFAIGIFGPWGSGKTTLMNAVAGKLDKAKTVTVDFSAWRYEREQHLLVPLLDTIREALVLWADTNSKVQPGAPAQIAATVVKAARETASTMGRVITSLVAGLSFNIGLPGALEFSFAANDALAKAGELDAEKAEQAKQPIQVKAAAGKPGESAELTNVRRQVERRGDADFPQSVYHACFRALKTAFDSLRAIAKVDGATDLRFVVFVDDLDRCLPQGALEVLEAIKLFFEVEGFVFVVGLDRSIVERFIEQRYAQAQTWKAATSKDGSVVAVPEQSTPLLTGADYIKKIFQVPFNLSPVQLSQLGDLINVIASDPDMPPEQAKDLRERVLTHLRVAFSDVAVNPREVKRYINSYVMQMKIAPRLNADVVLALQTLKARNDWKAVDDALATYRDEFLKALQADVNTDKQAHLADLDQELATCLVHSWTTSEQDRRAR